MRPEVTACDHASWTISRESARTLIAVEGELDYACAGAFAAAIAVVASSGSPITVDLGGVTFVDAAALDALGRLQRLYAILGLAFLVRSPSSRARRMLVLYGLEGLIEPSGARPAPTFGPTRPGQSVFSTRPTFGS